MRFGLAVVAVALAGVVAARGALGISWLSLLSSAFRLLERRPVNRSLG